MPRLGSRSKINYHMIIVLIIFLIITLSEHAFAKDKVNKDTAWPKFGLAFQNITDFQKAAKTYYFYWGSQKNASTLRKFNNNGIYLPVFNLIRVNRLFAKKGYGPDHDYITTNHPDWLLRYKDGSLVYMGYSDYIGPRLDLGNPSYVDHAIKWLKKQAFEDDYRINDFSLDNAMFFYADKRWAKYDTNESYRDVWEYFLRRLSEAFRPQHKIVLNVGTSDLPTFARMIHWVDGVLYEDLCHPPHKPGFDPEKAYPTILDRWQKGQWCAENGKIWAVRYNTTIQALKMASPPGMEALYVSVGKKEMFISNAKRELIHRLDFTSPQANTLEKLARFLEQSGLQVSILNPYQEAVTAGTLAPVKYQRLGPDMVLKFEQPPREAFLFGYAAVAMVAGPNSFYILKDERNREYYYPEMDQPLGRPLGPMSEIAPQVYKREFDNYTVFLNLSAETYPLGPTHLLPPWRGTVVTR